MHKLIQGEGNGRTQCSLQSLVRQGKRIGKEGGEGKRAGALLDALDLPDGCGLAINVHPKEKISQKILDMVLQRATELKKEGKLWAMGEAGKVWGSLGS